MGGVASVTASASANEPAGVAAAGRRARKEGRKIRRLRRYRNVGGTEGATPPATDAAWVERVGTAQRLL